MIILVQNDQRPCIYFGQKKKKKSTPILPRHAKDC
eukprot:COSAG06_NODE_70279_length_193_cov_14.808511_1_plen_34_part_10